jgi:transposase
VVYSQGEDRLMNIYGCPWCYPAHPAGFRKPSPPRQRCCPSCGSPLKDGSFAIARVFERPGRKVHVHVLGCPSCRRRDGG